MANDSPSTHHWRRRVRLLGLAGGLALSAALLFGACSDVARPTTSAASDATTPAATATPSPTTAASPDPTTTRPAPTTSPSTTTSTDPETAIKDVITRANHEQEQAIASGNASVMRDTSTTSYYATLVETQQEMEQSGVKAIALQDLSWGQVVVQGQRAQATTTETWKVTYSDGTSETDTARNLYTLVQQNGAWLIATDTQGGGEVVSEPTGATGDQSSNWAGYAATGGTYTSVSGTWTVPTVSSTASRVSLAADATWVGIGGASSSDLIQAGTQAQVINGRVEYSAWIEMLPAASQTVSLGVHPGDVITVTITEQGADSWHIAIADKTTGQSYQTTVQYHSSRSSAEWIQEAPSTGSVRTQVVPLDNFGQVQFQDASAVVNGQRETIADTGATAIQMYARNGRIATTSALGSDGASFTVTRVQNGI